MPSGIGGDKKKGENWIPMDARLFLILFHIALFWHDSRLLARLFAGCCCLVNLSLSAKRACLDHLRPYRRLQIVQTLTSTQTDSRAWKKIFSDVLTFILLI